MIGLLLSVSDWLIIMIWMRKILVQCCILSTIGDALSCLCMPGKVFSFHMRCPPTRLGIEEDTVETS
jgi:hypothetical protein